MAGLLTLLLCTAVSAAPAANRKAPAESGAARLADHEARRVKFRQLCANPTPSQRETLEIWAQGWEKKYGTEFCADIEHEYFGTEMKPRTANAAGGGKGVSDLTPFQYFGGITSFNVSGAAKDLSPIANHKALESLYIEDNKHILDISVIANFKNLKTLSLRNTQVVSLAPLTALSSLETLNLHMESRTGLPKRTGLDGLRNLKSLKQLDIDVGEPLGDQLKDLRELKSLVIYGPVKDVCSLNNLIQVDGLHLIGSGIRDISCLKNLKELAFIDLGDNPIRSIAELAPLPKLTNLSINNTLIEDLSAFTGNPDMFVVRAEGTPLRWCSPKTAPEIKRGLSCFYPDGKEKPWWRQMLRWWP
jgi:hypothetical protein